MSKLIWFSCISARGDVDLCACVSFCLLVHSLSCLPIASVFMQYLYGIQPEESLSEDFNVTMTLNCL